MCALGLFVRAAATTRVRIAVVITLASACSSVRYAEREAADGLPKMMRTAAEAIGINVIEKQLHVPADKALSDKLKAGTVKSFGTVRAVVGANGANIFGKLVVNTTKAIFAGDIVEFCNIQYKADTYVPTESVNELRIALSFQDVDTRKRGFEVAVKEFADCKDRTIKVAPGELPRAVKIREWGRESIEIHGLKQEVSPEIKFKVTAKVLDKPNMDVAGWQKASAVEKIFARTFELAAKDYAYAPCPDSKKICRVRVSSLKIDMPAFNTWANLTVVASRPGHNDSDVPFIEGNNAVCFASKCGLSTRACQEAGWWNQKLDCGGAYVNPPDLSWATPRAKTVFNVAFVYRIDKIPLAPNFDSVTRSLTAASAYVPELVNWSVSETKPEWKEAFAVDVQSQPSTLAGASGIQEVARVVQAMKHFGAWVDPDAPTRYDDDYDEYPGPDNFPHRTEIAVNVFNAIGPDQKILTQGEVAAIVINYIQWYITITSWTPPIVRCGQWHWAKGRMASVFKMARKVLLGNQAKMVLEKITSMRYAADDMDLVGGFLRFHTQASTTNPVDVATWTTFCVTFVEKMHDTASVSQYLQGTEKEGIALLVKEQRARIGDGKSRKELLDKMGLTDPKLREYFLDDGGMGKCDFDK